MSFSFGGLASGIDTQALVDGLVGVAKVPLQQLTTRKAQIDAASQTISGFSSKLSALKSAALALSTPVGFASFSATASDAAIVATASGSANVGSYAIEVSALARAQKSRSDVVAASTTALGQSGTLSIAVAGGDPVQVEIAATDTLLDVADKITASGARVTASVMNTGSGYRLLVQGLDSGAENAFTISEVGVTLGLSNPANVYEAAQDAALTVDGMAVTSKTNQFTGVLPGITLALTKTTTSPVTVQVAADRSALEKKITAFVNAYNDFVNTGHNAAGFGATKATNPILAADRTIRGALRRMGGLLGDAVPGASGRYTTLASVGVKASRDGTLSFDATAFGEAMNADPAGVRRLFVTDATTGATGLMKTIMSTVDGLVTGAGSLVQSRLDALSAQSKRLGETKIKMESRIEQYEMQLKKQFIAMDQVVGRYQSLGGAVSNIDKLAVPISGGEK